MGDDMSPDVKARNNIARRQNESFKCEQQTVLHNILTTITDCSILRL